ncbi:MAG: GH3 auxin-responsive promoter family protein [Peptococcaceae bacterium]|nr:GH3 auxin-responsive promoter family protein [Peptococcaceae bacterium]
MGKKYVPEQVAEKLGYYYQNGWNLLFEAGQQMQDDVLMDIISLGNNSAYAQEHGFAGIQTKEAFRAKVPISEYVDYRKLIEENMHEDCGQLTSLETEYYLLSTGMSNSGKIYVENRLGAQARQMSINIWNMMLTQLVPIMTAPDVKMLAVTNCSPLEEAPNGKAVRRTSSQAAKALWEQHPQVYVFPYEFLEASMSNDDRDYLTALYTLKEKNFNMLFCNNLAYFGVLLDWIALRPQQMIDDIRNGYMTADLQEQDRAILAPSFQADAERADELQALLDTYGALPVEKIWPKFEFVGAWLAGSVGRLARDVMRRLPENVRYISESYGASEGMFNLPMDDNCAYAPLAPYSCYFEFLPLEGGEPVDMAGVKDGHYYELLITTYSGLYRYNLHDIVRVHGFTGTTANIEFCCRTADRWELAQGGLYGYELEQMVVSVEHETGQFVTFYQGMVENGKLSLVIQPFQPEFDAAAFYQAMQSQLQQNGMELGSIYITKQNYCIELFNSLMQFGRTIQTIKLPLRAQNAPEKELLQQIYNG